jgi:hypothetical protein
MSIAPDVKQALDNAPQIHFAGPPQPLFCRDLRRLRIFGQRDKLKANRSKGA